MAVETLAPAGRMAKDPICGMVVPTATALSRATMRKIRQNLIWAFLYNSLGVPIAAFGWLNPMIAGAAMALSSLSVIVNSSLLRGYRDPQQRLGRF